MKVPQLSKFVGIISTNKVTIIAVFVALGIAIPATAMISSQGQPNSPQPNIVNQSVKQQAVESTSTQQTSTAENIPKEQASPTPSTSARATTNNNSITTSQISTSTPTNSSPTPQPTVPAAPTNLSTCLWQGPQNIGEYCPYSPPSSWSLDYVKYPCRNITSGELIPCPNYREFTGINNQNYSNDTRGLCQFTISAKKVERNVIVDKAYGTGYPDCTTATPL